LILDCNKDSDVCVKHHAIKVGTGDWKLKLPTFLTLAQDEPVVRFTLLAFYIGEPAPSRLCIRDCAVPKGDLGARMRSVVAGM
jgi:hypothetical protein